MKSLSIAQRLIALLALVLALVLGGVRWSTKACKAQSTGAQQISDALAQLGEAARQTAESLRQSTEAIDQLNSASLGLKTSVENSNSAKPPPVI